MCRCTEQVTTRILSKWTVFQAGTTSPLPSAGDRREELFVDSQTHGEYRGVHTDLMVTGHENGTLATLDDALVVRALQNVMDVVVSGRADADQGRHVDHFRLAVAVVVRMV